mgnify:CR=1 FL=1
MEEGPFQFIVKIQQLGILDWPVNLGHGNFGASNNEQS